MFVSSPTNHGNPWILKPTMDNWIWILSIILFLARHKASCINTLSFSSQRKNGHTDTELKRDVKYQARILQLTNYGTEMKSSIRWGCNSKTQREREREREGIAGKRWIGCWQDEKKSGTTVISISIFFCSFFSLSLFLFLTQSHVLTQSHIYECKYMYMYTYIYTQKTVAPRSQLAYRATMRSIHPPTLQPKWTLLCLLLMYCFCFYCLDCIYLALLYYVHIVENRILQLCEPCQSNTESHGHV